MRSIRKNALSFGIISIIAVFLLAGCSKETDLSEQSGSSDLETAISYADAVSNMPKSEDGQENADACSENAGVTKQDDLEGDESVQTETRMILTINGQELTAALADNSSAQALKEILSDAPLTISMRDYGSMEKVGEIGADLPTNDERITTEPGDLILYMENAFVIYYAPNSWNFTRLGKIDNITAEELKDILGDGDVQVILSLSEEE